MKRYLLPENGQFYKANLHCHTTISDGIMTPEEVKEHYKAHGYSAVAYTDHCVMVPHHDLTDDTFVALTAYENEQVSADTEVLTPRRKHSHSCYIALKKDNVTMPYYCPKSIWGNGKKYMDQVKFDYSNTIETWGFGADITNKIMRLARDAGFFVTYNHPAWSTEHYEDYSQYTGMCAMEIMNFGSWQGGYGDYNPRVYEELLRKGERIYCIATDDNHSYKDTCGGWTMIKADRLEYECLTSALEQGNFYASFGPEIHELWFEDGTVHIKTSPAKRIVCSFMNRRASIVRAPEGEMITEATFPIIPSDGYFRLTVMDQEEHCADTNAYFTDELF